MNIQTERLEIIALPPDALARLAEDTPALEAEWNCRYQGQAIEGGFRQILLAQAEKAKADPDNYLWHSFWLVLRRADRVVVGTVDFKSLPDRNGVVEIGYGLGKRHRGQGYMTETVEAFCRWAKTCQGVHQVVAETEADNLASEAVLRRCGFVECFRDDSTWWFR